MSTRVILKIIGTIVSISMIMLFVTCGGGGGGGGSASPESTSFSISGTVSGAVSSGVTITLSGTSSGTATTNASGNYTFTGLANGSYTVSPSQPGYTFTPTSEAVAINGANITSINFVATANTSPTYTISGTVTLSGGGALPGVTITLSGNNSGTAMTDASGNYTFTGLTNGSYTVTPSLSGYTFTPPSIAVAVNGVNITSVNFTATANSASTYSISGTVTLSGGGALNGVTMTLKGTNTTTTQTDTKGNYTFTGLANGSYTVSPSLVGYTFTPASKAVTINGANASSINFVATIIKTLAYSISGTVTLSGGGALPGVTITLSGDGSGTATTDASGNYTFKGLTGGSYSVTPSQQVYIFIPTSLEVTINGANSTSNNFTAYINVAGTWKSTFEVTSGDCHPIGQVNNYTGLITQNGNQLTMFNTSCSIIENTIKFTSIGPSPTVGGTGTSTFILTVSQDGNSMSGTQNLSWTNGSSSCSETDTISCTKISD